MSSNAIFEITDCIDTIDLLNIEDGYLTCEWLPAVADWKDGGSWQSSPLSDGKRLASKSYENAVETIKLTIKGRTQDSVIAYLQSMTTMLEKAIQYWTTNWQRQPVWLKARGATESNPRYAIIKGYKIDGLANPFSQPFFGNCKSIMNQFTLVIERDHWIDQFPMTGHRIEINNLQDYTKTVQAQEVLTCSQPADNAVFYHSSGYIDTGVILGSQWGKLGLSIEEGVVRINDIGLRFPLVNIPKGSIITDAYLSIYAEWPGGDEEELLLQFDVRGELTPNANIFDDSYTNYINRLINQTINHVNIRSEGDTWTNPSNYTPIFGIGGIIQELINQYGWVSGNAIVLFLNSYPPDFPNNVENYRDFGFFNLGAPPILYINYTPPPVILSAGHEDTDTGNVYISNKHALAHLTHIYYNDIGVGYSSNLIEDALPWNLLPAVPAVGDEICFGIANSVPNYGPFHSIAFNLSTAGVGITLQWYVYSATYGWVYVNSITDKSVSLTETGECIINLSTGTISPVALNGITGYWCKAIVSAVTGVASPPVQATRAIYTVVAPFVDIDGLNINGEIPALARIRTKSIENIYSTNVIIGARSKSRGEDFTPYLNYSDRQFRDGIIAIGSLEDNSETPTGRCMYFTKTTLQEEWYSSQPIMIITNPLSSKYQGVFHAYLRVKQTTGDFGDFTIRLTYSVNGMVSFTKCPPSLIPSQSGAHGTSVIDCGIINLETSSLGYGDYLETIHFYIDLKHNVATESTVEIIDLILMPCDEWMGAYKSRAKGYTLASLRLGGILDADAIGNPRLSRAILRADNEIDVGELNEQFVSEYIKMTGGGPFLQVNSDQRLWFLTLAEIEDAEGNTYYVSDANAVYSIRVYIANRYLTMRGAI